MGVTLLARLDLSRRLLVTLVPPHARKINAVEQHGQLRRSQHQTVFAHRRPLAIGRGQGEVPLLQSLVPDRVAVLVPVEELDPVAPPRAKHEKIARQRVLAQMRLYQRRQRVETLAHVGRQCAQEDPAGQGQAQHDGSSNRRTSWRSTSASKPARTRKTRPPVVTTSNTAEDTIASTVTGRNAGGAGV